MAKKILFSFELEPGMIACEDVFDNMGRLIIPKGAALDEEIISKLEFFSILEVPIDNEATLPTTETIAPIAMSNYSEKVRKTGEFIKFSSDYDEVLAIVKKNLDDLVVNHTPIDSYTLINGVQHLIKNCRNTIQIFDILNCLIKTDEQVYHHALNVSVIGLILGKWLGFPKADLEQIILSGVLHDVGKLTIPKGILNKSGKLTDAEYEIVKSHAKKGYNLIRNHDLDIRVKEAVLLHHERCDGSGYPFAIKQNKIPAFAKIIAISDVYDAMTTSRSYRNEFCPFDVIRLFDSEGVYKYEPGYILTFMQNIVSSYLHNNVRLSDGREGEIIMINSLCLYKPIVKCDDEFIDLTKEPDLKIESII